MENTCISARRRAALKTKKLRHVGKSKSTDTEEEDVEDVEEEEGLDGNEVVGEDGKLNLVFLLFLFFNIHIGPSFKIQGLNQYDRLIIIFLSLPHDICELHCLANTRSYNHASTNLYFEPSPILMKNKTKKKY